MSDTNGNGSFYRGIVAAVAPFAVMSAYLFLSRWPTRWFTAFTDYAGIGASAGVFIVAVLLLPIERKKKLLIAVCGTPVVSAALFYFGFIFVGYVFNDWL